TFATGGARGFLVEPQAVTYDTCRQEREAAISMCANALKLHVSGGQGNCEGGMLAQPAQRLQGGISAMSRVEVEPLACHSDARFLREESAFLGGAKEPSANSRFLLFATRVVGMTRDKGVYSSSSFTSPRSALAFSMIFSCCCPGTKS